MRILHVLDHSIPLHSGYTFRTRAILAAQRARGWETVHVTGAKQGPRAELEEDVDGLHFFRTPSTGILSRVPVLDQVGVITGLSQRITSIIEARRPDLVHAHSPALNGIAAIRAARRHRLPVVYECRAFWEDAAVDHGTSREGGPRYRITRALESWVFRHADHVFTICEGLRGDIISRGIDADRVTVIPNAVDIARFNYSSAVDKALRDRLALGPGPVIGFLGSFYAYEGLDILIDALPRLRDTVPGIHVLLVGGGNEEASLRERAAHLGVLDLVHFTGRVPHHQIDDYYGLVDLLAYPRKSMRLTELVTPLKPLEAMAQGKLVVASDVGGHRELIDDGRTGFLFRAGSSDALAERIRDALSMRENWDGLRKRARDFVEKERDWSASVARYTAVYERLVQPPPVDLHTGARR